MTTYVALLRGINVGGNRKILMADLRRIVCDTGCGNVSTYIQSGNLVLTSPEPEGALSALLEKAIAAATGFDVPVVLRSLSAMRSVVDANPFADRQAGGAALHVMFFCEPPPALAFEGIDAAAHLPEELALVGRDLYLYLPHGMGRAELPTAVSKVKGLGRPTARNWNSVTRLLARAEAIREGR